MVKNLFKFKKVEKSYKNTQNLSKFRKLKYFIKLFGFN